MLRILIHKKFFNKYTSIRLFSPHFTFSFNDRYLEIILTMENPLIFKLLRFTQVMNPILLIERTECSAQIIFPHDAQTALSRIAGSMT
jgi:hypothetical protein